MSETIWIRIKEQRLGRIAHRISLRTGFVACGLGQINIQNYTPGQLQSYATQDERIARCKKCLKTNGSAL